MKGSRIAVNSFNRRQEDNLYAHHTQTTEKRKLKRAF